MPFLERIFCFSFALFFSHIPRKKWTSKKKKPKKDKMKRGTVASFSNGGSRKNLSFGDHKGGDNGKRRASIARSLRLPLAPRCAIR